MEIRIDRKGNNLGTIGWLAKGLESGELKISEGSMKKNDHHGLWLSGGGVNQFLAAFNQYDHKAYDHYADAFKYETANYDDRGPWFTDAAWEVLMTIAQQWCDQCNQVIEDESAPKFTISRVEVHEVTT
jgi:hypothetical protein